MTSLMWNCNAAVLLHFVSYAVLVLKRRYDNDHEADGQDNVSFQSSTVGKWRKQLLETGSIQKEKSPGRLHSSTDAATMGRILAECACLTQS